MRDHGCHWCGHQEVLTIALAAPNHERSICRVCFYAGKHRPVTDLDELDRLHAAVDSATGGDDA